MDAAGLEARLSIPLSIVYRVMRDAFGGRAQIGWQAATLLASFGYAVLVAVAAETLRQFTITNTQLANGALKPRVRVLEGPVRAAIREILAHPDRHLDDWR